MTTYELALFLHIAALLGAISLAGALHASEWLAPSAKTVGELRVVSTPQRSGKLFPVFIVLLFAFGGWLLHLSHGAFGFGDGWVWTAVVTLVLLGVSGGAILGRHAAALGRALATAPDGPVTPELRAMALDEKTWAVSHANTLMAVGVVVNMVAKMAWYGSAAVIVGGAVVGAAFGTWGARRARAAS